MIGFAWMVGAALQESWVNPPQERLPGVEHLTFMSASMRLSVGYAIYRPPAYATDPDRRFPVVYYLHGMTDCEATHPHLFRILDGALREGSVPPMILVYAMCGRTSWFVDAPDGSVMGSTVFLQELVPHIDATHRTIATRDGRGVMGWSMGGHGAFKFGLQRPDLFGSAMSFGGGFLDGATFKSRHADVLRRMFGDSVPAFDDATPAALLRKGAVTTPLRMVVGTKDFLLPVNRRLKAQLEEQKIPFEYEEIEGAGHEPRRVFEAQGLAALKFHARHFR